jgi:drug/metabolite transporter (DMT)-like permease
MKNWNAHRKAVLMMVGATLCWSSAGVLIRSISLTDVWEIIFWRSIFMCLFVFGWLWQQYRGAAWQKIHDVGIPGLVSAALLTVMFFGFIVALSRTTVANTLIVLSSGPFFAALFGWLFLREQVALRTWAAMIAAFSGIVVIFVSAISHDHWIGTVVAMVIPLAYGLNIAILRKMHATVDMIPAILLAGVFSILVTAPFAMPLEASGRDLLLLAMMGSVQVGLGCVLMTIASRNLAAAEIGLLSILETIFGILLTWALVSEQPSSMTLAGGVIVIAALAVNQLFALRSQARSSPIIVT